MERLAITNIAHHHKNYFAQLYCNHRCKCYHSIIQSMRLDTQGAGEMCDKKKLRAMQRAVEATIRRHGTTVGYQAEATYRRFYLYYLAI